MFKMKKGRKYGNIFCEDDRGNKYPSLKQMNRAKELQLLEKHGKIKDLKEEVTFDIIINDKKVCKVRVDFVYYENGEIVYEDSKGILNEVQTLRYKLFAIQYGKEILLT